MPAFYNEIDPYAAQWLRNLIAAGHIASGVVDERSIEDIRPDELAGYSQCHFFAGIGVWSRALRLAGWPDDRPVWTGSCPCQPFSAAGKGGGFADERHLWPAFHWLISQCRPPVVFGEQVASRDGLEWLDLVQADLEGSGYAGAAADLCAAGVGAPHIRQRLYWVADTDHERRAGQHALLRPEETGRVAGAVSETAGRRADGELGYANDQGLEGHGRGHQAEGGRVGAVRSVAEAGELSGVADAEGTGSPHRRTGGVQPEPRGGVRAAGGMADAKCAERQSGQPRVGTEHDAGGRLEGAAAVAGLCGDLRPGPTNSYWRDADWLFCRDGKWRAVEPGTFPLAHGATARVGRLRAYGNAIVPQVAQTFIEAYVESKEG